MKLYNKKVFYIRIAHVSVLVLTLASLSLLYPYRTEVLAFTSNQGKFFKYKLELSSNNSNMLASAIGVFDDYSFSSLDNSSAALSVPVLLYHGIVPVSDRFSMTNETFKDQM